MPETLRSSSTVSGTRYAAEHVCVEFQADAEEIFVRLFGARQHCFWLDSSLVVEGLSRWSFLGDASGPRGRVATYRLEDEAVRIYSPVTNTTEAVRSSIFDYLENQHRSIVLERASLPDLPFLGGHVGYFGYELKSLTCGVPSRSSNTPDAAFIHCERFLAIDHLEGLLFIVALYPAGDSPQRLSARRWLDETSAMLESVQRTPLLMPPCDTATDVDFHLHHDRATYLAQIDECLEEISAGETYEVCLTNQITAKLNIDPLKLYRVLRRRNPAPYSAFLRFGDLAVACSSPERFLRIDRRNHVETKPIKGTARRDCDPDRDRAIAESLRLDEKSRAENLMIVDLMRNDLGRVCETGTVTVPSLMAVESYRTVHQLVSVIRGRIRSDENAVSCITSCFPGGSMTGAPKIRTLEIIERLEGVPRGIYSGALGYLSYSGDVDLNIVIRTVVCTPGEVSVGCGGAIVALSDPVAEFDEIILKAQAPLAAIAEVATGSTDVRFRIPGLDSGGDRAQMGGIHVRMAAPGDAAMLVKAVHRLLRELGGPGPQFTVEGARAEAGQLLARPELGFAMVIEAPGQDEFIGVATVSCVHAVRSSGPYGVLQELWVDPRHRADRLGGHLLEAVDREARRRSWPMVEVSLPMDSYPELPRLVRFYEGCGYTGAGMRLRRRTR